VRLSNVAALGLFASSCALLGCAAGLSTSQPAHVPEPGHSQVEAGVDLSFSTDTTRKIVRAAQALEEASRERELSEAEQRAILLGAAELAVNPPAVIPHLGFAVSPFERWELGFRFATSGFRIGARRQLLAQEESRVDLTVGLGLGLGIFTPPIEDVLESVAISDFRRVNVDVPIVIGQHGVWFRWWAGPRFLYSDVAQEMTLALPDGTKVTGTVGAHALYLGGVAGAAFGYKRVFIGPELVLMQLVGGAEMRVFGSHTEVDLDSFVVYPAFAVMGEL
jgi:hypothetical protein